MIITPERNQKNRRRALSVAIVLAILCAAAGWFIPPLLIGLALCPLLYWLLRRRCLQRLAIMRQPFPPSWEQILQTHVAYFRALGNADKQRFRQMVQIFLDEVRITG